jgi:hypothetical protein
MDLSKIPRLIDEGVFKQLMFPTGKYYINEEAIVVSMNSGLPKIIPRNARASGEQDVVLFIPYPTVFGLPELLLMAFDIERPSDTAPCYRDFDPSNVTLANVYWGDMEAQRTCRNKLNLKHIEEALEEQALHAGNKDNVHAMDSMLFVNKTLLQDLTMLGVILNRLVIDIELSKSDVNGIRGILSAINDISCVNVVKRSKLDPILKGEFNHKAINEALFDFRAVMLAHTNAYQKP